MFVVVIVTVELIFLSGTFDVSASVKSLVSGTMAFKAGSAVPD